MNVMVKRRRTTRVLAAPNKHIRAVVHVCWYGCRMEVHVNCEIISLSKTSNDGIGGGGSVNRGGEGRRDIDGQLRYAWATPFIYTQNVFDRPGAVTRVENYPFIMPISSISLALRSHAGVTRMNAPIRHSCRITRHGNKSMRLFSSSSVFRKQTETKLFGCARELNTSLIRFSFCLQNYNIDTRHSQALGSVFAYRIADGTNDQLTMPLTRLLSLTVCLAAGHRFGTRRKQNRYRE